MRMIKARMIDSDNKEDNKNFGKGMDSREMTRKFPLSLENIKNIL